MARFNSSRFRALVIDGTTLVVGVATIFVAVSITWDRMKEQPRQATREDRAIEDWERLAQKGHRIGVENAEVTIIEFGDYECPFCRRFEASVRGALATHPDKVALVYRHFPLRQHPNAYRAARLAECAALQNRFEEAHRLLYRAIDLATIDPRQFGERIGISEIDRFVGCARRTGEMDRVEEDLEDVRELGLQGTPSVIINGVLLGSVPDSSALMRRVAALIE